MAPHVGGYRFDGRTRCSHASRRYRIAYGAALLLMRTIGIRDLVLGLGTVSVARSNDQSGARRWLKATLASDVLDSVVSLAGSADRKTGFAVRRGFSTRVRLRRPTSAADCLRKTEQPGRQ